MWLPDTSGRPTRVSDLLAAKKVSSSGLEEDDMLLWPMLHLP